MRNDDWCFLVAANVQPPVQPLGPHVAALGMRFWRGATFLAVCCASHACASSFWLACRQLSWIPVSQEYHHLQKHGCAHLKCNLIYLVDLIFPMKMRVFPVRSGTEGHNARDLILSSSSIVMQGFLYVVPSKQTRHAHIFTVQLCHEQWRPCCFRRRLHARVHGRSNHSGARQLGANASHRLPPRNGVYLTQRHRSAPHHLRLRVDAQERHCLGYVPSRSLQLASWLKDCVAQRACHSCFLTVRCVTARQKWRRCFPSGSRCLHKGRSVLHRGCHAVGSIMGCTYPDFEPVQWEEL